MLAVGNPMARILHTDRFFAAVEGASMLCNRLLNPRVAAALGSRYCCIIKMSTATKEIVSARVISSSPTGAEIFTTVFPHMSVKNSPQAPLSSKMHFLGVVSNAREYCTLRYSSTQGRRFYHQRFYHMRLFQASQTRVLALDGAQRHAPQGKPQKPTQLYSPSVRRLIAFIHSSIFASTSKFFPLDPPHRLSQFATMRLLPWIPAVVLALAACTHAQADAGTATVSLHDEILETDGGDGKEVFMGMDDDPDASDGGALPLLDDIVLGNEQDTEDGVEGGNATTDEGFEDGNVTSIESIVMLALDTVPAGVVECNRGGSEIDVLFGISVCFTDDDIQNLLTTIDQAIVKASSNQFYFNNAFIKRDFKFAGYKDGACQNTRSMTTSFPNLQPVATDNLKSKYDLYVNIGKGSGDSFTTTLKYKSTPRATLEARVCASGAACGAAMAVVSSVADFGTLAPIVTSGMYCDSDKANGANPYTYTSPQGKRQCGCGCPDHASLVSGQCKCSSSASLVGGVCQCPGDLVFDASGQCGCTYGRTATTDNKCICLNGGSFSTLTNTCDCPPGTTLSSGYCVKPCYWQAGNVGYTCNWSDQTKSALKLLADCGVQAPAAKDNYVADKRVNKNDQSNPITDPLISITATKHGVPTNTLTKAASWVNYYTTPGDLENQVQFTSFGVFDLSMVAKDYRDPATCSGCIAIKDTYPPTPIQPCQALDSSTIDTPFSSDNLKNHIDVETAFKGFYSSGNVKNNGQPTTDGDNVRADDKTMQVTDFFQTAAAPGTFDTQDCFTNNYVANLLTLAKDKMASLPSTVASGVTSSLVCKRCCSKSITLKENVNNYQCGVDSLTTDTQGTSNCQYGRCLSMAATSLITVSSTTTTESNTKTTKTLQGLPAGETRTDANYIHRSVTCTSWSGGCTVQPKLSDLITKDANWVATAGVPSSYPNGNSIGPASNFVFWRYKDCATGTWKPWNDNDQLTFKDESTELTVQAWSPCGKVNEFTYTVVLHLHTEREKCKGFLGRFVDSSPNPHKVDGNICAYPGSDFALLTFNYDSTENLPDDASKVKGKYTSIKCDVTVAAEGATASTTKTALVLPGAAADGSIKFAKKFALELVKVPSTDKNTDVDISCTITFQYYDDSSKDDDSCSVSLRLTECNRPLLQTYSTDVVCMPNTCSSPTNLPGPGETCAGDIYTTVTSVTSGVQTTSTTKKGVSGTCCSGCSQQLTCSALPEATTDGLKRCVPPAVTTLLMAMTMDENEDMNLALEEVQPSSSTVTMLLGASAMVAVVALAVVSKARGKKAQPVGDGYEPLLD